MSYRKNIASNFVTQVMVSVIAFITSIAVARSLGPSNKGYISYLILIFMLIGEYGNFGILKASIYYQKRTEFDEKIVFNNNQTFILLNFLIVICVIVLMKTFNIFLSEYSWFFVVCGLFIVLFTYLNQNKINFYIGNERICEVNKVNLIINILKSVLVMLLWSIGKLNIETYIFIYTIALAIQSTMLYRKLGIKFKPELNKILILGELKFGIAIYFSTLFIYLNYRLDQLLIKNMLGQTEMGVYSISVALAELLFLIPGSVGTAILGKLYNIDRNSVNERKRITSLTVKYTFYICLIVGVIGILMTPLIPVVYGEGYSGAMMSTRILFIGIIFASIGKVSSSYFQSIGNTKTHLIITFVTLASNVALNLLLIPYIGIEGAAIASSVSYSLYGIMYIVAFVRLESFEISDFFVFDSYDINIIKSIFNKIKKDRS